MAALSTSTPARPCAVCGDDARHVGPARLDRRTKRLVGRLAPGDIAVIDHAGIDRLSAEGLVAGGGACVVNVASSSSTRYPNLGPSVLVAAGVHLVDAPGAPLFETLADGDDLVVEGGRVITEGRVLAHGSVVDERAVAEALGAARGEVEAALEAFVANTMDHLRAERELLAGPIDVPALGTEFANRPALVVARGSGVPADLRALRPFVGGERPVLVGVDGGADALLEVGLSADVIVGDMDSASDEVLLGGAELVVHRFGDGRAPGGERLRRLGLAHHVVSTAGTSEDAALLLAAEKGARPVVSVGSGMGLTDLLDRGRPGMASSLLTRLRLGENLIDARGLRALYLT